MQRVECDLPSMPEWGCHPKGRIWLVSPFLVPQPRRALAKHSSLMEPLQVDLPDRDPLNLEGGWIGLHWGLLEADSIGFGSCDLVGHGELM